MTSRYRRIDDAIAQSDNVERGPWQRRAPVKNPPVRPKELPVDVARIHGRADQPLDVVPAHYMLPAAILGALMDCGVNEPATRAVYENVLDRLRTLTEDEDERVALNAVQAIRMAFARRYV